MADYGKSVRKELKANDCYLHRQGSGDHEVWYSPLTERKLIVDYKIKSRHTANEILKAAGIGKKF